MDEFKKIATVDQLVPGQGMTAVVNDKYVAVFNVNGEFHALDGVCPHMGGLLGNGTLDGCVVKCPEHGMRFDVVTGGPPGGRGLSAKKFAVKVEGEDVMVSVTPDQKEHAMTDEANKQESEINPWGSSLDKFKEWDPKGAELLLRVGTDPWTSDVLPRKEVELISLAVHSACTNLNESGTRRHVRAALEVGATRDEVLLVFKLAAALAIHSCSLGAPILLEEMKTAGVKASDAPKPETPACDAMREIGQWNTAWDSFYELSPGWTDKFFGLGANVYQSGIFTPRFMELISIAFDASITHMYAPGTRRHIKGALKAGATPEEIMAVLQLCVSMGLQAFASGLPILEEELQRSGGQAINAAP
jgi:nitrite reductase/ring-hydroxylating ferredoxin subunit/alkylhydroperoxidase/carboxymuconolactone decarboxylase family protein YurZ